VNQPYILEGANRFDALQQMGTKSFPAQIVIDRGGGSGRPRDVVSPAQAIGVEAPVNRRGALDIPQWFKDKLNAVEALRGAMTGQKNPRWSVSIPDEKGTSLFFPAKGKSKPELMTAAAAGLPPGSSIADLGAGRAVLNTAAEQLPLAERERLLPLIGETKLKPGKTAPPPYSTKGIAESIDYATDWAKQPGSRAVTEKMFGHLDKLQPAELRRLDGAVRGVAGDLMDVFLQKSKARKEPLRADLMNMLRILKEQGLEGVRDSLKAGGYLPAIALAILGGQSAMDPEASGRTPAQPPSASGSSTTVHTSR